jgi:hypothetical protein
VIIADYALLAQLYKIVARELVAFGQKAYGDEEEDTIYDHALISDDTMDDLNALVVGMQTIIELTRGDLGETGFARWLMESVDQWFGLEDPRSYVEEALRLLNRTDEADQWQAYADHRWDDETPVPPLIQAPPLEPPPEEA